MNNFNSRGAPVFNQMHLSVERDFEMAVIIFYFTSSTKWCKETANDKTTIMSPHTPSTTYMAPYLAASACCYGSDKQKQAFKNLRNAM